jgi:hypothetical protein
MLRWVCIVTRPAALHTERVASKAPFPPFSVSTAFLDHRRMKPSSMERGRVPTLPSCFARSLPNTFLASIVCTSSVAGSCGTNAPEGVLIRGRKICPRSWQPWCFVVNLSSRRFVAIFFQFILFALRCDGVLCKKQCVCDPGKQESVKAAKT